METAPLKPEAPVSTEVDRETARSIFSAALGEFIEAKRAEGGSAAAWIIEREHAEATADRRKVA